MATRRSYLEKPKHLYVGGERGNSSIPQNSQFEFDESELWDSSECNVPGSKHYQKTHPLPLKKPSWRSQQTVDSAIHRRSNIAMSLPVNVPDWSKILRDECNVKPRRGGDDVEDDDDVDEDDRIPPHEYLARTRMASFSVQEGVGRTLKGRDLSRVRNAIWEQTGYELD